MNITIMAHADRFEGVTFELEKSMIRSVGRKRSNVLTISHDGMSIVTVWLSDRQIEELTETVDQYMKTKEVQDA